MVYESSIAVSLCKTPSKQGIVGSVVLTTLKQPYLKPFPNCPQPLVPSAVLLPTFNRAC